MQAFTSAIPQAVLDDLKTRIAHTRWPDEIAGSGWQFGASLPYMKELAGYWQHSYNWRKTEDEINAWPNYIANVNGYKIHYIHIKGKGRISIPLIITHGWPGSFIELLKIIPLLTEDAQFSFDLVIPSLPGFGFSQRITEPGCNSFFVAGLWVTLMQQLGYSKFMAQGGDLGAGVSTALALKYPGHLLGIHLNFIPGSYRPYIAEEKPLTDEETQFLTAVQAWSQAEGSYSHQHSTKPLTLAYGLNDSPVGLCAWIIEKFQRWSDSGGNIETVFTKDALLANVTLYWVTQTIHSSIRIYHENSKAPLHFAKDDYIKTPVAIAYFPKELPLPPQSYVARGFNVQRRTLMPAGGHFAAMEQPALLAADILQFAKSIL